MIYIIIFILLTLLILLIYNFQKDIRRAKQRLLSYPVKSFNSSFGHASFVDQGDGEVVLVSHGIFGGYDQGLISLNKLNLSNCRKLSPSRFGYPGSDLPNRPTPKNQALAFKELLDYLEIDKVFLLATSAGGSSGLQFAIHYPDRIKGLILLSSGAPDKARTIDEVKKMGLTGPPSIAIHNFTMWFVLKFFGKFLGSMFGSNKISNEDLLSSMFPIKERRNGVIADTKFTNTDMTLNYKDYPLEEISCPILVIHAKDDQMAHYEIIQKLLNRVKAESLITDTGGHLIEGFDCSEQVQHFIDNNK